MCVHVCVHACVRACVCVRVHVCVGACVRARVHACVCVRVRESYILLTDGHRTAIPPPERSAWSETCQGLASGLAPRKKAGHETK